LKLDHVIIVAAFHQRIIASQRVSRPVLNTLSRSLTFVNVLLVLVMFCCRCWQHEQLHAICRPLLAYCPFWCYDVVI